MRGDEELTERLYREVALPRRQRERWKKKYLPLRSTLRASTLRASTLHECMLRAMHGITWRGGI